VNRVASGAGPSNGLVDRHDSAVAQSDKSIAGDTAPERVTLVSEEQLIRRAPAAGVPQVPATQSAPECSWLIACWWEAIVGFFRKLF